MDIGRNYAIAALGEIGDQRAVKPLIRPLLDQERRDVDGRVTELILVTLGQIGDRRAIPVFRRFADDENWRVASAALGGLQVVAGEDVVTPLLAENLSDLAETRIRQRDPALLRGMGETAARKLLEIYNTSVKPDETAKVAALLENIRFFS